MKYIPHMTISQKPLRFLLNIFRKIYNWIFLVIAKRRGLKLGDCKLDEQQVETVVACEDAQLVLASAGSGKTMSLLAKIEYLVNELKIEPERILAISFTAKTVEELVERCGVKGVEFRTFHALGNSILRDFESGILEKRQLITEEETANFIKNTLLEHCENDERFARKVNDFILFFLSAPSSPGDYASFGQKISLNRLLLRNSLRSEFARKRHVEKNKTHQAKGFRGEIIRSKEDQLLANWLFVNLISYEYQVKIPNVKCKATFGLKGIADNEYEKVYLDMLSLNRHGESLLGLEYWHNVKTLRNFHKRAKTKHIECYSYQWDNLEIFSHLEEEFKKYGIEPHRLPENKILSLIQKDYQKEFEQFLRLLNTFLSLYKNSSQNIENLRKRAKKYKNHFEKRRTELFLDIFEYLNGAYQEYLEQNRLYDFADMIDDAVGLVQNEKSCMMGYEYILLDEVQDLSPNRQQLIRAILDKNPKCRLFAVGDDWQSIYRFTGSNIELINDFAYFFGRYTRRSLIETTHRFGSPTVNRSSNFVQKNPVQAHKRVRGLRQETPIKIIVNQSQKHGSEVDGFRRIIKQLLKEYSFEALSKMQLQIISRFNQDIKYLSDAKEATISEAGDGLEWRFSETEKLHFDFCSIHKSKGITRDIIIVLNMNDDLMGMPAQRENDPLLDLLLAKKEKYAYAEERRLFYVAITRARKATYLIANEKNPSPFLYEISDNFAASRAKRCPRCETGELVKKSSDKGEFFYCSNFLYGCNYLKHFG